MENMIILLWHENVPAMMGWFWKKFKCEACGAKFKTEKELVDHAKTQRQRQRKAALKTSLLWPVTGRDRFRQSWGETQSQFPTKSRRLEARKGK
jgi:hypothetical protein